MTCSAIFAILSGVLRNGMVQRYLCWLFDALYTLANGRDISISKLVREIFPPRNHTGFFVSHIYYFEGANIVY